MVHCAGKRFLAGPRFGFDFQFRFEARVVKNAERERV
jgi:hypothetical protein